VRAEAWVAAVGLRGGRLAGPGFCFSGGPRLGWRSSPDVL